MLRTSTFTIIFILLFCFSATKAHVIEDFTQHIDNSILTRVPASPYITIALTTTIACLIFNSIVLFYANYYLLTFTIEYIVTRLANDIFLELDILQNEDQESSDDGGAM